jgi:hypothetical protein
MQTDFRWPFTKSSSLQKKARFGALSVNLIEFTMLFAAAKSSLAAFGISTDVDISVTEHFFHICHI